MLTISPHPSLSVFPPPSPTWPLLPSPKQHTVLEFPFRKETWVIQSGWRVRRSGLEKHFKIELAKCSFLWITC